MTQPVLPRLTIGLPVFNGEAYLIQALDSLLGQTYTDFELIISDNASTDSTPAICAEYAARDPRVRVMRLEKNVGAAENFNRVFALAQSEYFKWAAHDDLLAPTFLEQCIEVLDSDPSVVLAYTRVSQIDHNGVVSGAYDYPMRVDSPDPLIRYRDLVLVNHFCVAVFGVMRRDVLARTPLIAPFVGSDRVLLAELALYGRLLELPDYAFFRRDHPDTSGRKFDMRRRLGWYDPHQGSKLYFPYWRMGQEFIRAAYRAPLTNQQRTRAMSVMARWYLSRRRQLFTDLKAAVLVRFPFLSRFSRARQKPKSALPVR